MKIKTLKEMRAALAKKPTTGEKSPDLFAKEDRKTYMTLPFYTPSDDLDVNKMTEKEKKTAVVAGKLMGTGEPIAIAKILSRGEAINIWMSPNDFTYDNGTCYKAWIYTWVYLALTVLTFLLIHPLIAVILAWKTGHNWGQYTGGLVFGKDDMKGKAMYRTA